VRDSTLDIYHQIQRISSIRISPKDHFVLHRLASHFLESFMEQCWFGPVWQLLGFQNTIEFSESEMFIIEV